MFTIETAIGTLILINLTMPDLALINLVTEILSTLSYVGGLRGKKYCAVPGLFRQHCPYRCPAGLFLAPNTARSAPEAEAPPRQHPTPERNPLNIPNILRAL